MPDITMCTGGSCPFKDECYRYRARPSEHRQSFMGPPVKYGWGPPHDKYAHCEHLVAIEPGDDLVSGQPDKQPDKPAPYRGFKYL